MIILSLDFLGNKSQNYAFYNAFISSFDRKYTFIWVASTTDISKRNRVPIPNLFRKDFSSKAGWQLRAYISYGELVE